MQLMRSLHLYLGCIFAPLIIFYAVSGAWQVYRLQDSKKEGSSPLWLRQLSAVHQHQALNPKRTDGKNVASKVIAAVMSLALAATTVLGIVLSFKFGRNKIVVTLCLVTGVIVPGLLLYFQR